jgi:hypothetical protein
MGCTMHWQGWLPYVGGLALVSGAIDPPCACLFWSFPLLYFDGLEPSQGGIGWGPIMRPLHCDSNTSHFMLQWPHLNMASQCCTWVLKYKLFCLLKKMRVANNMSHANYVVVVVITHNVGTSIGQSWWSFIRYETFYIWWKWYVCMWSHILDEAFYVAVDCLSLDCNMHSERSLKLIHLPP